ncbi:hypothetical protein CLAIMM_09385 [Cladophialophora immunda]|nr:hypothetical protein CLAIMM_09385 [Cladophialophora immunda]
MYEMVKVSRGFWYCILNLTWELGTQQPRITVNSVMCIHNLVSVHSLCLSGHMHMGWWIIQLCTSASCQPPTMRPPSALLTRHHIPTSLSVMNCHSTKGQLLWHGRGS